MDLNGKNDELVRELVALATRYGILTPYTSFMADEGTNVDNMAANIHRAGGRLEALEQSYGAGGFAQRSLKGAYQTAATASAAAAAPLALYGADPAVARDLKFAGEAAQEAKMAVRNVQNVGNRTFFRRDGQWVDSQVTAEQQHHARRIKQFSDEYFELAARRAGVWRNTSSSTSPSC